MRRQISLAISRTQNKPNLRNDCNEAMFYAPEARRTRRMWKVSYTMNMLLFLKEFKLNKQ